MMETSFKERLKYEIVGILLVGLGLFLFLSLISYHPLDPSFNTYTAGKVHNWMGRVGSYTSDLFYVGFGFPSFLIPFLLGVFAFSFIFRWEWKYLPLKLAGWLVILLASSSLLSLWLKPIPIGQQSFLTGGVVGKIFSKSLVQYLNLPGATIFLLVLFILSFVLGTGISFISLLQHLGKGFSGILEKISTLRMVRKEQARRAKKFIQQEKEIEATQ